MNINDPDQQSLRSAVLEPQKHHALKDLVTSQRNSRPGSSTKHETIAAVAISHDNTLQENDDGVHSDRTAPPGMYFYLSH